MSANKHSLEHVDEPADKKCKVSVPKDDFACSLCRELMCDPRILNCGHSFCTPCIQKLKHPRTCPECRTTLKYTRRNYFLRKIIEAAFPVEYQLRAKEFALESWLEDRMERSPSMRIQYGNMDRGTLLAILQTLDDIKIWENAIFESYNLKTNTSENIQKRFSGSCLFQITECNECVVTSFFGRLHWFKIIWNRFVLTGANATNEWFPLSCGT